MSLRSGTVAATLALFIGMLLLLEGGRQLGVRVWAGESTGGGPSLGAIDGALLGLLSLVLAFSFSAAASRFEARRKLAIEETNAIGTAWLRVDLLPDEAQPRVREDFRRYVDARLAAYDKLPDVRAAYAELERAQALTGAIWSHAMAALTRPAGPATILVAQALNAMIDMFTTQTMSARQHAPRILYVILALLALIGALVVGESAAAFKLRWWFHSIAFAALFALTYFVMLELEYPRLGFIRIDDFDRELRRSMGEG